MRRVTSLLFLLLTVTPAFAGSQPTLPDWVAQLAAKPVGTYPPRTNAVVLLDQTSIVFTGPNEYQETYRRVVRILRPEGREERELLVHYRQGERINNIHAWSQNSAGHVFEVKDKEFLQVSPYATMELYSDSMMMTTEVPGADVGSIIAFEYNVTRHPIANQIDWDFQETLPVAEARLVVELPSGTEYKTFWANSAPVEPSTLSPNRLEFLKRDLPGIEAEDFSPSPRALFGRMALSYYSPAGARLDSWKSIGLWNNTLTADRRVPTPEIADKARQLTAGATTFDAKVRPIANFLQRDVRYVAIEIGIGGFQPHAASEIFKHRYGDCKDKATLMSAMLQAIGIDSRLVLIHTQHGAVAETVPSIGFNHEILAIELPADAPSYRSVVTASNGKKYLIFDPTDEYTPLGDLHGEHEDNLVLLSTEAGGELIRLPLLDPDSNHRERDAKFILSADGGLSGEVNEKRNGYSAWIWRASMKQMNDTERTRYIERYFSHSLKGIAIKDSRLDNLDQLHLDLVSHYNIAADKYAQNSGQMLLVRPRVLGSVGIHFDWKERKRSFELGSPEHEVDSYEIQIPEGYVVDDMPDPVQVDVGFASYKSRFEKSSNGVKYWREYVVKNPFVGFDKLAELHKLEDAIGNDEFATVVLMKK
jgi:hypothetical protein